MESPFKFKVNDMVWYLSNNQVALGRVVNVHFQSGLNEGFLKYKVKLTDTHHKEYSGEEKSESELFSSREELINHLSTVKELK